MGKKQPSIYINHGGGPLPLLGKQPLVSQSLHRISHSIETPKAIIVISAHYQRHDDKIGVMCAKNPSMLFDYYGFPKESYDYSYPAKTDYMLSQRVAGLLETAGFSVFLDESRGFDHGIFVPLMLMYPDGDVPIVGISIPHSAESAWQLGQALHQVRNDGVLILGSGASFHNIPAFMRSFAGATPSQREDYDVERSKRWDDWLRSVVLTSDFKRRKESICQWKTTPHADFAHPSDEHLLPLFACLGAASDEPALSIDDPTPSGIRVSQFIMGGSIPE